MKSIFLALAAALAAVTPGRVLAEAAGRPLFDVRPQGGPAGLTGVPFWAYSLTYNGTQFTDFFVGASPQSGQTVPVTVAIVPVALTYGSTTYSPLDAMQNGLTPIDAILSSPLFTNSVDFVQRGRDIGETQYTDAVMRASFWRFGGGSRRAHVVLKPTVLPLQSITVPADEGLLGNQFGTNVIEASEDWFNTEADSLIGALGLPNTTFVIFVTTQTYLLTGQQSGCCVGGFHTSDANGVTYAEASYIQTPGAFAQDVSALSHEIGEWMFDPVGINFSPCGKIEVGDPLVSEPNYGSYPYVVNGITYNLQDLVLLPYFDAPPFSVHGWMTFQGTSLTPCQNGS